MKKIVDMEKWNEFADRQLKYSSEMGAYNVGVKHMADDTRQWLNAQPDAEEKHGKWNIRSIDHLVYGKNDVDFYLECSQCGRTVKLINKNPTEYGSLCREYPYCHCGAKMYLE